MIAYEILKKKPQVSYPVQQPYHARMGLFERLAANRQRSKIDNLPAPVFDLNVINIADRRMPFTDELVTELRSKGEFKANPPNERSPIAMGKIQYAQWLNAIVYPTFKKHALVTFKTIPIVLNSVPRVFFVTLDIQEMHYWVQMDKETLEPKAVGIALPGHTIPCYYPPSVLRPLVQSEVEAIDKLRNQKSEGRDHQATGDDGIAIVSIDRSTGEIHEES